MGRGEESLLCDAEPELRVGERERERKKNKSEESGWEGRKNKTRKNDSALAENVRTVLVFIF